MYVCVCDRVVMDITDWQALEELFPEVYAMMYRSSEADAPIRKGVLLPDKQLRTVSMKEMTEHEKTVRSKMKLTAVEDKALRTQRRRVRNRQSAMESRKRKLLYVNYLEQIVQDYGNEIKELRQEVKRLRSCTMK